jgi:hypothetical protein
MKLFFIVLFALMSQARALEVDEKLTVRIVKTSDTRKTVMVNRGIEDGLVEGDHAKFIVTAGIVARGVVVKVSPTRSVWSIYRVVNADFIVNDSVMTIKITPAVKVTKDETQALVQEDTPSRAASKTPIELGIPLAEGAQDITPAEAGAADMTVLNEEVIVTIAEKNKELVGIINISGLTAKSKTETGDDSFNSSQSYHHIGLGGELYPTNEREWYSKFSLIGSVNLMRQDAQAYNGAASSNAITEFSLGTNWHPTKLPSAVMEFIPFFTANFNFGTVKSTYKPGANAPGGTEFAASGGSSGFSLGFGYKFYIGRGFGARALLDYYMRTEKYKADDITNVHNRVVGGPRLMIGLSYRF